MPVYQAQEIENSTRSLLSQLFDLRRLYGSLLSGLRREVDVRMELARESQGDAFPVDIETHPDASASADTPSLEDITREIKRYERERENLKIDPSTTTLTRGLVEAVLRRADEIDEELKLLREMRDLLKSGEVFGSREALRGTAILNQNLATEPQLRYLREIYPEDSGLFERDAGLTKTEASELIDGFKREQETRQREMSEAVKPLVDVAKEMVRVRQSDRKVEQEKRSVSPGSQVLDVGYIYIGTNVVNDRQYVGQSARDPRAPGGRIQQHLSGRGNERIAEDLASGANAQDFRFQVVAYENISRDMLAAIERGLIKELETQAKGYNISAGGELGGRLNITEADRASAAVKALLQKAVADSRGADSPVQRIEGTPSVDGIEVILRSISENYAEGLRDAIKQNLEEIRSTGQLRGEVLNEVVAPLQRLFSQVDADVESGRTRLARARDMGDVDAIRRETEAIETSLRKRASIEYEIYQFEEHLEILREAKRIELASDLNKQIEALRLRSESRITKIVEGESKERVRLLELDIKRREDLREAAERGIARYEKEEREERITSIEADEKRRGDAREAVLKGIARYEKEEREERITAIEEEEKRRADAREAVLKGIARYEERIEKERDERVKKIEDEQKRREDARQAVETGIERYEAKALRDFQKEQRFIFRDMRRDAREWASEVGSLIDDVFISRNISLTEGLQRFIKASAARILQDVLETQILIANQKRQQAEIQKTLALKGAAAGSQISAIGTALGVASPVGAAVAAVAPVVVQAFLKIGENESRQIGDYQAELAAQRRY